MPDQNPNPVERLTVDFSNFNADSFKRFINQWRVKLANGGEPRQFDFDLGVLPLPVLPAKVENQELIEILLAAKGANLDVFIEPDSLYTVGFVCHSGKEYALFEKSKHLLPKRAKRKKDRALLKGENYAQMGGFIDVVLDRDTLANKLIDAIHGLATYEGNGNTDDLGKKMGVIVQVIIEPIRFRILQEQYICFFSANAQVALKTPIDISEDNGGGYGQNDRVASDPVETVKVHEICNNNSHVDKWIEKNWVSLSKIALEAHENDKYKKGYELKGSETYSYRLKNKVLIEFQTIEDLVKALGVAKEKESSSSSMFSKIASFVRKPRKKEVAVL